MTISNSLIINIKLNRLYIVQMLAENIAENLRRRFNYEVSDYYNVCVAVLQDMGMDRTYVKQLMHDVIAQAYEMYFEYKRTGFFAPHNGTEIHPEILISKPARDLVFLLKTFDQAAGNIRHEPAPLPQREVM